ncbi:MAG: hypothetical protein JOZ62_03650 [Acidobacteriaceae bacterium]|nr:hypothetical protein [Acidobacteriaceae bacterium]
MPSSPASQNTTPGLSRTAAGLESPWDVRQIVANVVRENEQLKPLLAGLNPQDWYDKKGAASTYILQWQTAQRQLTDVEWSAKQLSQKTESLSLALDLYFRLEALETSARSLADGDRKYGDRPSADQFAQLIARNFSNRERLRDYLRDLATSVEQNFKIADEEAQRCRGMISKDPCPSTGGRSKRR